MSLHPISKPNRSYNSSGSSEVQCKQCLECKAILPVSSFGLKRTTKDGYANTCKACRSEYQIITYTRKHGRRSNFQPADFIRIVSLQNASVIDYVLSQPASSTINTLALAHSDLGEFVVDFVLDKSSVYVRSLKTGVCNTYTFVGVDDVRKMLLDLMRLLSLRLELTQMSLEFSKTQIYYMQKPV